MSFGIFMHRADSIYDDRPAERYQFPGQYLNRAKAFVGDWIIYYEPRKVPASRGYFAVAKVERIIPDPAAQGMYVALINNGSYLDFPNLVPFRDGDGLIESGLLNKAGGISGRAQAAIRPLVAQDFYRIVDRGLVDSVSLLPRLGASTPLTGMSEEQTQYDPNYQRDRTNYLSSRIFRDSVFRRLVLSSYDQRCAVTGLKLINGSGRAEVEAAHIRPVQANGPDIRSNGIALSGTAHWMFDRGLIGLADDLTILVSRHVNDESGVRAMLNRSGRVLTPARASDRPHPIFMQWHRDNCFKH